MKKNVTTKNYAFGICIVILLSVNDGLAQNYFAGTSSGSGNTGSFNTGVGGGVLVMGNSGNSNSAFGYNSLRNNTGGSYNAAVGALALFNNTTGHQNIAVGMSALYSNESGDYNVGVGNSSLYNNTTGSDNIGIGQQALYRNVTGIANISIGKSGLYNNTSGFYNISLGLSSLFTNSTGSCNVSVGVNSMYNNQIGNYTTAIGFNAADGQVSYTRCTFLGNGTDATVSGLSNATAIGNGAVVDASNKVVVGNTAVTSIGGWVNWTNLSDRRLKTNINKSKLGLDFILSLNPVTYNYTVEGQKEILQTGLIAQEVDEAAKRLGVDFNGVDKSGEYWGIRYATLTVPLIKAMQELEEKHAAENETLISRIEKLEAAITHLEQQQKSSAVIAKKNFLFQNQPNPASESTVIRYALDEHNAMLVLRDLNGKALRKISLATGNGTITINAGELVSGTYTYSLIVHGECVDTKLMIIAK